MLFGGIMASTFATGQLGKVLTYTLFDCLPVAVESVCNWFPLFVLGKLVSSTFKRVVTAATVVYCTLFYARILHVEELALDFCDELESYLTFGSKGDNGAPGARPEISGKLLTHGCI